MAADDRLQRLLGAEPLAALRLRLRQRHERTPAGVPVASFRIGRLTPIEHAALAALQGRPARYAASMQVDVAAIDDALRRSGVADSLRAALEQLDGPITDRNAEREALQHRWREVHGGVDHPALARLLDNPAAAGLLKRLAGQDPAAASRCLVGAAAVLRRLPADGLTRAQLAAGMLGDAHALDTGCAVATLVLAVLRSAAADSAGSAESAESAESVESAEPAEPAVVDPSAADPDAPSARDLWASAGVLVNELARPALVLNLPTAAAPGDRWRLGEPMYLSLRQLLRSPPDWAVGGRSVFVCENPNLLAIAADRLGAGCVPMVCTDGMPAAAQRTLLTQLAQAGAALHYHGDFDWAGVRIGNHVMREHGARPWRFGAVDYRAALADAPSPGRALVGAAVDALWDAELAAAMRIASKAIDEEMVADSLLPDLLDVACTPTLFRQQPSQ